MNPLFGALSLSYTLCTYQQVSLLLVCFCLTKGRSVRSRIVTSPRWVHMDFVSCPSGEEHIREHLTGPNKKKEATKQKEGMGERYLSLVRVFWTVQLLLQVLVVLVTGFSDTLVVPDALLDAQSPGGKCVSIAELGPEEMLPACKEYLTYDRIYYDILHPFRHVLANALTSTVVIADTSCVFSSYQFNCPLWYRPCYEVEVPQDLRDSNSRFPETLPVAGFICEELCESHLSNCGRLVEVVEGLTDASFSCDEPWDVLFGEPQDFIYPPSNYTIEVSPDGGRNSFTVELPCYSANQELEVFPPLNCPEGLHKDDAFCSFNCPEPLIEDDEYDDITLMLSIVSWFSFVLSAVMVCSYSLNKSRLQFPGNLPFCFILCVMCSSFAFCLGSMIGHENIWCEDAETTNYFGDPACTVQGIIFVFFTLAGVLWWLGTAINLFMMVVLNAQLKSSFVVAGFHVCCWGFPLIVVIISLSAEKLGFSGSDLWCTVHSDSSVTFLPSFEGVTHTGGDPNFWNLFLITTPILLCVLVGVILLILVFIIGYTRSNEGWKYLKNQWRVLAFLLLNVWIYAFVFSFQIHFEVQRSSQYDSYDSYINCLFNNIARQALSGLGTVDQTACELEREVVYPLWFIAAFNIGAQGFFVFVIFGTTPDIYSGWVRLVKGQNPWTATGTGSSSNKSTGLLSEGVVVMSKKMSDKLGSTTTDTMTNNNGGGDSVEDGVGMVVMTKGNTNAVGAADEEFSSGFSSGSEEDTSDY